MNLFLLLTLSIYAVIIAKDAYTDYKNYTHTNKIIKISLQLSSLLHQLQKERGISTGYITSKNPIHNIHLVQEQKLTDEIVQKINSQNMKEIDLITSLELIRNEISKETISSQSIIDYYSSLNQQIITKISDYSRAPQDAEIRDFFNSFVVFISSKEKTGVERAVFSNVFENNAFSLDEYKNISALLSEQKALLEVFTKTATPKLKKDFTIMIEHKVFQQVKEMEMLALQRYEDINIESNYWFDIVSIKIDTLKSFEQKITQEIITLSENKSFAAQNEFILIITITLIIFLYTFLISYSIGSNILSSYQGIKNTLKLINNIVIVSETDVRGTITYVSQAFCDISGYTREELLGKTHNILRHEDMPKEVFKGLWSHLKKNQEWTGEIKNKRKDGAFYWVYATITSKYSQNGDLSGYIAVRQDITDKKKVEEISIKDGLTDLYNRRHFDDLFPKIINTAKRNNELVCFMMLDVDFFKPYNDTYGHHEGDLALIAIANAIKSTIKRAGDYPFRLGGEEFGVIFQAKSKENAQNLANTLKTNIQDLQIPHEKNPDFKVITVSIGLVCMNAQDIKDQDTLYKQADNLLYKSKESGRNTLSINV